MKDLNQVDILLVEDNPNDVELTLRALKKNNLANRVFVVKDGAKALDFLFHRNEYSELLSWEHPRVVFLDLKLPKVSGLEVLEKLKADPYTSDIPVVVLTSSAEEPDIRKSYELGANSYIVKPVDFNKFFESVAALGFYWLLLNQTPK